LYSKKLAYPKTGGVSHGKVKVTLKSDTLSEGVGMRPKKTHYDCLETDDFWTYLGEKKNKVWLIYTYYRESGEIVAYVWGKRDIKTAKKLMERIKRLE
jgi:hypothetical protein